jgi:diacylglycerol kinase (ATP)
MPCQREPERADSICVIFNPAAGKSHARQRLETLQPGWRGLELWSTERPGHATELARKAAEEGFEVVAAAGGDGTVHEVANGILQAERPDVSFGILPLGSANDYAFSLRQDRSERDPGLGAIRQRVDVGRVRTDTGAQRYFVCCMGIGFSGSVTAESRRIRWLQGTALYGLAAMRALWRRWQHLDLELRLDEQAAYEQPTLMLSFMVGRREGGFLMAPESRLDKGVLEVIQAGRLNRWDVLRLLPQLAFSGPPPWHPKLSFAQCRRAIVTSRQPLSIHTDGEILCLPEDRVFRLEIELLTSHLLAGILEI